MLLIHVESFLAIVRAGGLTRAAEALFITQPALTERLKLLEADLGTTLFARTKSYGLQLTESGTAFLPHAQRIVKAANEGIEAIAFAARGGASALVIGVTPIAGMAVVARAVADYREAHPETAVRIRTGSSEDVVDMVVRREIALGLTQAVRRPDLQIIPLYADELVLVAAVTHPLMTRRSAIRMRDLASHQLIQVTHTLNRAYLARAFPKGPAHKPGPIEVDSVETAKMLVRRSVGIAFLPRSELAEDLDDGLLGQLPLVEALPTRTRVVGLQLRDEPLSEPIERFIELLREPDALLKRARTNLRAVKSKRAPG